jgi:formylmethanofuran dehydrogenase subunit E-like metal-binding protein
MINDPGTKTNTPIKLVIKYRGEDNVLNSYSTTATRLTNSLDFGVWDTRDYPMGEEVYFSIGYEYDDLLTGEKMFITSNEWKVKVIKSDVETDIVSTNTVLQLTANGRSNTDSPEIREKWTYFNDIEGEITTTFSNINWINDPQNGTGWIMVDKTPALRLAGKSTAIINCHPFSFKSAGSSAEVGYNLIENGFTIELDFAIRDVNNHDAVAMHCMYDKVGFEVRAN